MACRRLHIVITASEFWKFHKKAEKKVRTYVSWIFDFACDAYRSYMIYAHTKRHIEKRKFNHMMQETWQHIYVQLPIEYCKNISTTSEQKKKKYKIKLKEVYSTHGVLLWVYVCKYDKRTYAIKKENRIERNIDIYIYVFKHSNTRTLVRSLVCNTEDLNRRTMAVDVAIQTDAIKSRGNFIWLLLLLFLFLLLFHSKRDSNTQCISFFLFTWLLLLLLLLLFDSIFACRCCLPFQNVSHCNNLKINQIPFISLWFLFHFI